MYLSKTIALKPLLLKSKTVPAGTEIYPAECLYNVGQAIQRGEIAPLDPITADGNLWAADPEDVPAFFTGANFELVQDLASKLIKMELDNPEALINLGKRSGRAEILKAIKQEALKRRNLTYHKEN